MGNESFSKTLRREKNVDICRNCLTTITIFAIQNNCLIRFKIDQNKKIEKIAVKRNNDINFANSETQRYERKNEFN